MGLACIELKLSFSITEAESLGRLQKKMGCQNFEEAIKRIIAIYSAEGDVGDSLSLSEYKRDNLSAD